LPQPAETLIARDPEHPGARLEHGRPASERSVDCEEGRLARVLGILAAPEQVPGVAEDRGAVPLVQQLGRAARISG
jgi:hypothetical protein